jgi:hypothetical protein
VTPSALATTDALAYDPAMSIFVTFAPQDLEFWDRDFRQHHLRLECAVNCDGGPCNAPEAPHDPPTPHYHLVMRAPDLDRELSVYVDPNATWRDD